MRSLWDEWAGIARSLAGGERAILLFDFDGTLAPIADDPAQARIPAATRQALAALARSRQVTLGIVSGRGLEELRNLVGIKNISYVGSHGLEWVLPGGRPHLEATPAQRRRIELLWRELDDGLSSLPGVLVERKRASVAVHFRNAEPRHTRQALALVERVVGRYTPPFKLLEGKEIVELLPSGTVSKGNAVQSLLGRLRRARRFGLVAYFGDDTADETVFARLRKSGRGVLVDHPRRTKATRFLRSPREVCQFLQRVRRVAR